LVCVSQQDTIFSTADRADSSCSSTQEWKREKRGAEQQMDRDTTDNKHGQEEV